MATALMENSLRGIPEGSLIISSDWNFLSGWYYWHWVRGLNPGVTVIDTNAARMAWYLDSLDRQYPNLTRMVAPELAKFRERLDAIETGRARRDDGTAHMAYVTFI